MTTAVDYQEALQGNTAIDQAIRDHIERLEDDPGFKQAEERVAQIAAGTAQPGAGISLQDLAREIGLYDPE